MVMEKRVEEALEFVHSYAPEIKEWKTLKKELLKVLPSDCRKQFSTRDSKTKVLNFNSFEENIATGWKKLSGSDLYLGKP
jgi:GGDEF domain-containing protein